jgi:hypothetical protein
VSAPKYKQQVHGRLLNVRSIKKTKRKGKIEFTQKRELDANVDIDSYSLDQAKLRPLSAELCTCGDDDCFRGLFLFPKDFAALNPYLLLWL